MKIVVIGGTGLIGSKTVAILRQAGHEVVAASPNSGVNTITGEGLEKAVAGAEVVIDLANSPSFEDKAVLEFFQTSGRNLHAAEAAAGVRHHVALSIVGTDRTPDNGYFRAKVAQEKLIEASGIPYTIIRSTQFLEFLKGIADSSMDGDKVRVSPGLFQPIAADDVAAMVADVALAPPRNGIVEIAGPERAPFNEIVARYLKAVGDPRDVVRDPEARYFGGRVEEHSLVPWAKRGSAASALTNGFAAHEPEGGFHETLSLLAAHRLAAVRRRPRAGAGGQGRQGDPRRRARTAERAGQKPAGRARRVRAGAGSPSHRHPASAFIYARVLEGAIRSKVNDAPERTYQVGEKLDRAAGRSSPGQPECQRHGACQALGRIRGRHQRPSDRHSGQVAGGQVCSLVPLSPNELCPRWHAPTMAP